jgi:hypothetical protein
MEEMEDDDDSLEVDMINVEHSEERSVVGCGAQ